MSTRVVMAATVLVVGATRQAMGLPGSTVAGEIVRADQVGWEQGRSRSGGAWFLSASVEQHWAGADVICRVDAHDGSGVGPGPGGCSFNALTTDEPGVVLHELIWTRTGVGDRLELTAGWIDPARAFDANAAANSETEQFLACSLVNSGLVELPDPSPGGMLWVTPARAFRLGGIALADRSGARHGSFGMVETQIVGGAGTYRAYGWTRRQDVGHTRWGAGCSVDHDAGGGLTLFLRAGWRATAALPAAVGCSAGGELRVGSSSMPPTVGLAREWISTREPDGAHGPFTEGHAEAYVRFPLSPQVSVSPDVQWVRGHDDAGRVRTSVVAGMRTRIAF